MKSDACSGMISQMNTLTNTVNGFSSSISNHETRIQGLEASSGGLIKADSYSTWADLYLPNSITGTFGKLHIHATNEIASGLYNTSIFRLSSQSHGFEVLSGKTTLISIDSGSIKAIAPNYSPQGIVCNIDNGAYLSEFNGVYAFNVRAT